MFSRRNLIPARQNGPDKLSGTVLSEIRVHPCVSVADWVLGVGCWVLGLAILAALGGLVFKPALLRAFAPLRETFPVR